MGRLISGNVDIQTFRLNGPSIRVIQSFGKILNLPTSESAPSESQPQETSHDDSARVVPRITIHNVEVNNLRFAYEQRHADSTIANTIEISGVNISLKEFIFCIVYIKW